MSNIFERVDPEGARAAAIEGAAERSVARTVGINIVNPPVPQEIPAGAFEPRRQDHLQQLVDVLKSLPPAKPTRGSLVVQLTAPIALSAKAIWELIAALREIVRDPARSGGHQFTLLLSIVFLMLCAWVSATMVSTFASARIKQDPHHRRVLGRAIRQLNALNEQTGEPLEPDDELSVP
jgi:hypothetical protein